MSIRPLSSELQKRAESELNEDTKRTPSDVQALRQWLKKQPHLASIKPSDQWIAAFLRGTKFSLERCKEKIDMYYTLRSIVPEFFSERDPFNPKIQEILKIGACLPLRSTESPESPRSYLIRLGTYDPSRYHLQDLLKVSLMITEIMMQEDDNFVVSGQVIILDLSGVSFSVIGQFTPALARKVTACVERACPVRQRATHMLNTMPGFDTVFAMYKTFLTEKKKERIQVHGHKLESLYQYVPKEILPKEYGGETDTVQDLTDYWKKKVESYRSWFVSEESQKSEEKKRPGKAKTSEDLFGVDGSFRKLDFD